MYVRYYEIMPTEFANLAAGSYRYDKSTMLLQVTLQANEKLPVLRAKHQVFNYGNDYWWLIVPAGLLLLAKLK